MSMHIKLVKKPLKKTRIKTDLEYDVQISKKETKKLQKELTIKVKRNVFIAIILRKNGSALLCYVPNNCKSFSVEGNTYFNVKSGCYLIPRKALITVYLEGVILPIEHRYIVYQKHNVLLLNKDGLPVTEINENVRRNDLDDLPKDEEGKFLRTKEGFIIKRVLDKIKGLEFDSIIANAIYHSGLIEKVSKGGKPDKIYGIFLLLLVINIIIGIIAVAKGFM